MISNADILKQWKSGPSRSVWVLHGEEEFLRSELLAAAPEIFVPDEATRSFNCDILYGAETSLDQVLTIARSYPMMAERRLVIVRDAERMAAASAQIPFGRQYLYGD